MRAIIDINEINGEMVAIGEIDGKPVKYTRKLTPKYVKECGYQHKRDRAKQAASKVLDAFIWRNEI